MRKVSLLLLVLSLSFAGVAVAQNTSQMPKYSRDTVVGLAAMKPGPVAPNSMVTIFGENLAWVTRSRTEEDVSADVLPLVLRGTSVLVTVNRVATPVEIVSPTQVTFLLPPAMKPGPVDIQLTHNGKSGPAVRLNVEAVAPAFYQLTEGVALARHGETWEWVTSEQPARPGEKLMLYTGGLGATRPPLGFRVMPREEAEIAAREQFAVTLNGEPVAAELIDYVGVMPNFPGIYEIRLQLPENAPEDPEIRIVIGETLSPEGIGLPLRKREAESPVQPEEAPEGSNP